MSHCGLAFANSAQRQMAVHAVTIAAADSLGFDVALGLQVCKDLPNRALGDSDGERGLAPSAIRALADKGEDQSVVGQETP